MYIDKIKAAVGALPHRKIVEHDHLKEWLAQVSSTDPSRLLFHLERARGVGGSEIGTLLLEAQGLTPPFGRSGVQLAKEKLLRTPPSAPLPHMMRGITLEAPIIEAILKMYGGSRDFYSEKLINDADIPNRNGNVDFYWQLEGQKILVDVKAPISATEAEDQGPEDYKLFTYKAQVNHYDLIGETVGVKADKMLIAELDVPVELADQWASIIRADKKSGTPLVVDQMASLLRAGTPGMRINFIEVEPNLQINLYGTKTGIREAIPTVSDAFMQHLENGEALPSYVPEEVPLSNELASALSDTEQQLGRLRAISEYCERETAKAQQYLQKKIDDSQERQSIGTFTGDLFKIIHKTDFNIDSAISIIKKHPVDLDDLRFDIDLDNLSKRDLDLDTAFQVLKDNGLLNQCLKSPGFDPDKVKSSLSVLGENPELHQVSKTTFRKGTTNAAKAHFAELSEHTQNIDEYLTLRMLNAHHASQPNETEDSQEQIASLPALGMG